MLMSVAVMHVKAAPAALAALRSMTEDDDSWQGAEGLSACEWVWENISEHVLTSFIAFVNREYIDRLVRFLNRHLRSSEVVEEGLSLLQNFSTAASLQEACVETGALELALLALHRYSRSDSKVCI